LPNGDDAVQGNGLLAGAGLFMAFSAQAPQQDAWAEAEDAAPVAPANGKTTASLSELISGIRGGDIAIEGMSVVPLTQADAMGAMGDVSAQEAGEAGTSPDGHLDGPFSDSDTGSFLPPSGFDVASAFHQATCLPEAVDGCGSSSF